MLRDWRNVTVSLVELDSYDSLSNREIVVSHRNVEYLILQKMHQI